MDPLQFAAITHHLHNPEALSALPHAPVVPERAARWARGRAMAAGMLHRVADLLAPEPAQPRPTLNAAC